MFLEEQTKEEAPSTTANVGPVNIRSKSMFEHSGHWQSTPIHPIIPEIGELPACTNGTDFPQACRCLGSNFNIPNTNTASSYVQPISNIQRRTTTRSAKLQERGSFFTRKRSISKPPSREPSALPSKFRIFFLPACTEISLNPHIIKLRSHPQHQLWAGAGDTEKPENTPSRDSLC